MIVGLLGPKPVAVIVVNTIIVIISSRNACPGGEIRIDEAPKRLLSLLAPPAAVFLAIAAIDFIRARTSGSCVMVPSSLLCVAL